MPTAKKRKTAKLASTADTKKAATPHAFNPDHKIHLLVKENPKQKGSKEAARFAKYKNGMTVQQAFDLGMNPLNLRRDAERKCIKIGAA
jgi:hypothetical protein